MLIILYARRKALKCNLPPPKKNRKKKEKGNEDKSWNRPVTLTGQSIPQQTIKYGLVFFFFKKCQARDRVS